MTHRARGVRLFLLRIVICLEVLTIAWGALSFGAVYDWGYTPLVAASAAIGILAFLLARARLSGTPRIAAALAAIAAFMAAQLIPIGASTLMRWSAVRHRFLTGYDPTYVAGADAARHALSINPPATVVALACFVAFGLLLLGTARLVSAAGPGALIKGLTGFGLLLAAFALMQNVALAGRTGEFRTVYIYGFWPDPYVNKPFGPFINKNNFAGWMLMMVPLALGYAGARAAEARAMSGDWRQRVLWLSSAGGAAALLALMAAVGMGISLVMSLSRSGILALTMVTLAFAWSLPGARSTGTVRFARVVVCALMLVGLVVWVGPDLVAQRFAGDTGATLWGRVATWRDALRIARDFPLVGTGVNTFRTAMLTYQTSDRINYWSEAHNDYLQILAEGGIMLAALAAAAAAAVAATIRRRFSHETPSHPSYWIRLGAVMGILAIAVQDVVEFSLQIPGDAALFAVLVGIAIYQPARPSRVPA